MFIPLPVLLISILLIAVIIIVLLSKISRQEKLIARYIRRTAAQPKESQMREPKVETRSVMVANDPDDWSKGHLSGFEEVVPPSDRS
jgi:Flp pilus assembly protein CpaB